MTECKHFTAEQDMQFWSYVQKRTEQDVYILKMF